MGSRGRRSSAFREEVKMSIRTVYRMRSRLGQFTSGGGGDTYSPQGSGTYQPSQPFVSTVIAGQPQIASQPALSPANLDLISQENATYAAQQQQQQQVLAQDAAAMQLNPPGQLYQPTQAEYQAAQQQAAGQPQTLQMMPYTMQQGTGIAPGGALFPPLANGTTPAAATPASAIDLSGIPTWAWAAAAGAVLVTFARK
jgi:hypothetical protein